MNNLKKFKEHLEEAKKAGWDSDRIIENIGRGTCPFNCVNCPICSCCLTLRPCVVFKNKRFLLRVHVEWDAQMKWYRAVTKDSSKILIETVREVWEKEFGTKRIGILWDTAAPVGSIGKEIEE